MLMKVVLPAPLLPINPTTLSWSILTLIFDAAVTAPKVLFRSRASRTTAISCRLFPAEDGPEPARQEHDHQQHRHPEHQLPGVGGILVSEAAHAFADGRAEKGR